MFEILTVHTGNICRSPNSCGSGRRRSAKTQHKYGDHRLAAQILPADD